MPKPTPLVEAVTITEAAIAQAKDTGRLPVQLISPGWGSSGYYSADVLAEAATNTIIPAGTHMYCDHPTESEVKERPVRSLRDLMSVTVEDARVATEEDTTRWGADQGALVSEVDIVPGWQPLVEHLKDNIGVSIFAAGDVNPRGEAEGRVGKIVETLEYCSSVDWVTKAGRGGHALSIMESAQAIPRAIGHGISEATVNDTREALQNALRDAYPSADDANHWIWVRDFDESTVWFEIEGGEDPGVFGQAYTSSDDGAVELTGDRSEVRVVTSFVPVAEMTGALEAANADLQTARRQLATTRLQLTALQERLNNVPATRPDSTNPTATESEEDTMPKIQIEEAEHSRLTETAGRVDAVESENATLKAEITTYKEAEGRRAREDRARELVSERAKEAEIEFTPLEERGLLADLPLAEDGSFDEEAFTTTVDKAATEVKEAKATGQVVGFGSRPGEVVTESQPRTKNPWGRDLTEKGA